MVGDDVVDLSDAEAGLEASHPRFDTRVFTAAEREALARHGLRGRLRWILWAAKESAFKAARKPDPRVVFSPVRFAVRLQGEEAAWVTHGSMRFDVRLEHRDDAVHAVALAAPLPARDVIRGWARLEGAAVDLSAAVRRLAIDRLASELRVEPEALTIVRCGRIPRLLAGGEPTSIELSLSHHGRVVGFAAVLPTPAAGSGG